MPTSLKSSPNAFTVSSGGPILPAFSATARTAASTPAVRKMLPRALALMVVLVAMVQGSLVNLDAPVPTLKANVATGYPWQ